MAKKIHWLGAGLSSGRGILRLHNQKHKLSLYNRTVSKGEELVKQLGISQDSVDVQSLDLQKLDSVLTPGDVVVSMLPANFHPEIAQMCLRASTHLVTTSYLSDAMKAYDHVAKEKRLCFVNEVGLDPGIDHVFAHALVQDLNKQGLGATNLPMRFESYCGGFPKVANAFRYKFSWSPVGVLRALQNKARYLRSSQVQEARYPWKALTEYQIGDECFEAYPNRDSIPYINEYNLSKANLTEFVRGTLRLGGWAAAWKDVFTQIESAAPADLEKLGDALWKQHAYGKDEADRVVLSVSLKVFDENHDSKNHGHIKWGRSLSIDASGFGRDSAMASLVSIPAAIAVHDVICGIATPGVSGAPNDEESVSRWLGIIKQEGFIIRDETISKASRES